LKKIELVLELPFSHQRFTTTMSGHDQTYYKLRAKQFKNKEEVLQWADQQSEIQEKKEHELRETIAWCKEQDKRSEERYAEVKKLKEQLAAQEERTSFIVDLLTESQLHELNKHDYGDDDDESEDHVTAECNSCYMTKPCTVEEEDLKDGQEYYYCDECREDAKADPAEDEDEDEMQVYFETETFGNLCGEHEHLKEFHEYHYYQCWGGGPEGGYIVNEKNFVFKVERSWGTPFSVEKVAGFIKETERDGLKFIRII
jgi:hypothetical protein